MLQPTAEVTNAVDSVIRARKTTRAFKSHPVARSVLVDILELARTAPSTFNTQPWRVHVFAGAAKDALSEALLRAHTANSEPPHSAMPQPPPAACAARQEDFGKRYYDVLGIDRGDMAARSRQTGRNFVFFDAPVGMIFTIDASLKKHSWVDYGLFLQTLIIAAQARGLATCPQVSFVRYQEVIVKHLGLPADVAVVCGMSLGYAEDEAPLNVMQMPREPLSAFCDWRGL